MKSYKLKLTVETPTHIGTGNTYYDLEYTVKNKKFYVINKAKFFKRLEKLGKIDLFTKIAAKGDESSIIEIRKLVHNNFNPEDSLANFEIDKDALSDLEKKLFRFANIERHRSGKIMGILNRMKIRKTYKNPLSFKPMIPGSSIKGAIRTALISYLISKDEILLKKLSTIWAKYSRNPKKAINNMNNELISLALRNFERKIKPDTTKDILRFIKVSDFMLVDGGIKIGKAEMVHRKKKKTGLPVYLEYITEKSVFEGTITIDEEMAGEIFGKRKKF
ncbi:type III-A CRISPR-associated RAMP protein Csm5 [Desulfurobacterium sp.]|uniref:type III-A CRISPR-associated RAMP protein Csm5 n=1 Tax=Desulfurobacterium sp. TaxID=2004706 RepID=UPI002604CDD5|nr:type III-A CRISPR-associated RAMP protein Csm5 [Desulfurobacterium sp.]